MTVGCGPPTRQSSFSIGTSQAGGLHRVRVALEGLRNSPGTPLGELREGSWIASGGHWDSPGRYGRIPGSPWQLKACHERFGRMFSSFLGRIGSYELMFSYMLGASDAVDVCFPVCSPIGPYEVTFAYISGRPTLLTDACAAKSPNLNKGPYSNKCFVVAFGPWGGSH